MPRACLIGAIHRNTTEMKLSGTSDTAALTLMSIRARRRQQQQELLPDGDGSGDRKTTTITTGSSGVGGELKMELGGAGGILLLDEVSSSVDQDTDLEMQQIILDEFVGHTIVMVSYQLKMAMAFAMVVMMDQESMVEVGLLGEPVDRGGSWFAELWRDMKGG